MAIFHCKRVNLVNGVIFGVEGGIRDKRNFDISEFELHGTECSLYTVHTSIHMCGCHINSKEMLVAGNLKKVLEFFSKYWKFDSQKKWES